MPTSETRTQASMTMPLIEYSIENFDQATVTSGAFDHHAAISPSRPGLFRRRKAAVLHVARQFRISTYF